MPHAPQDESSAAAQSDPAAKETPRDTAAKRYEPGRGGTWQEFRRDVKRHGGGIRNQANWHLAVYHFGNWSLRLDNDFLRWLTSKIYGVLSPISEVITNVYCDRTTKIGEDFHLIHAEGAISIHPAAVIGDRVGIMHGVTIGSGPGKGAPRIGNDVFIGTGAVVIGNITVGDNVNISANSLVSSNVPSNSTAIGVPAKIYPRLRLK